MKRMKTLIYGATLSAMLVTSSMGARSWNMAANFYGHKKAREVGDLLTVRITEASSVEKDASRSDKKSYDLGGSASFAHPTVDDRSLEWTNATLPKFSVAGSRDFSGQGAVSDKDKFESYITVRVTDVLPNGDLLIEGKRSLILKNDTVQMILTGAVRVRDIDNQNTIESTRIADAVIQYTTSGSLDKTTKKGLIPRFVDWVNPF